MLASIAIVVVLRTFGICFQTQQQQQQWHPSRMRSLRTDEGERVVLFTRW